MVAWIAASTFGCSEEFEDCVSEWQDCTEECPSDEEIDEAYQDCLDACPPYDPDDPNDSIRCGQRCMEARTECTETCNEEFAECVGSIGTCGDPASTAHLVEVEVADWSEHVADVLSDEDQAVSICLDHFPPGTPEGDEVEDGIAAFNSIPGSSIDLFPLWQPHGTKSVIFAEPPLVSHFDYVDNANDSFEHPCHTDNTTACSDDPDNDIDGFAINTCRYGSTGWRSGGDTQFFTITANANCYDYFTNPLSNDYVNIEGAEHELGHAAGMNHTPTWPADDKKYIGTMQGKLTYLSAYDVAFLRHFYPETYDFPYRNFTASSMIRFDFGGPNQRKGSFEKKNPSGVYLVGDRVFDCETQAEAVWYAAWFNTGLDDQESEHCMVNELRIEDPTTAREAVLRQWHAAQMPAESQDHWSGVADTTAAAFNGMPFGRQMDLVFEVNVYEPWREQTQDNEVRAPILLHSSSACTTVFWPPLPLPIQQTGASSYELDRAFVNGLVATPERILRGAPLAPARVGSNPGFGYRFFTMEADSIPAALGAKKDDILWRVDGNPIGPNTAQLVLQRLLANNTVTVVVSRNGTLRTFTYRLR